MELSDQIRRYRNQMELSQEELAEKVYVTRQTISNWENGKCYPDIHSLLLLSQVFEVSLDQLIKGDIETMKEEIRAEDIQKMKVYSTIFSILFLVFVISCIPLVVLGGVYGTIAAAVLYAVGMFFAFKVEKLKKDKDVQTYKEIMAFMDGKHLDEITKKQEYEKRPYQKVLLFLGSAAVGAVIAAVCIIMINLF